MIGDGALTGGMSFEALNDAGRSLNNLIVVLNDNEFSISENVGGLLRHLSQIRAEPAYFRMKEVLGKAFSRIPGIGTGLVEFSKKYPKRFFDVGIAEQHAVTFAAGMAKGGLIPVFSVYSSFLQRAYDQIIHDVAMQNLHVVLAICCFSGIINRLTIVCLIVP